MDDRAEMKLIQEKLEILSAKQLEMIEAQQQPFYYRWLAIPDPKLEAIKTEIARLEKREGELYKVIQVRQASI
jgi:hypothetical protein